MKLGRLRFPNWSFFPLREHTNTSKLQLCRLFKCTQGISSYMLGIGPTALCLFPSLFCIFFSPMHDFSATVNPPTRPNQNFVPWSNWSWLMGDLLLWTARAYVQLICLWYSRGKNVCFLFPSYQNETGGHLISDPRFYLPHKSNLFSLFWT